MGILLLPPPILLTISPETAPNIRQQLDSANKKALDELAFLSPVLKESVLRGKNKGLQKHEFASQGDLSAQTIFLVDVQAKQVQKVVAKFVTITKTSNCQVLGVIWEPGDSIAYPFPPELLTASKTAQVVLDRAFNNTTPVSLNLKFKVKSAEKSMPSWSHIVPQFVQFVLWEQLAAKGVKVFRESDKSLCGVVKSSQNANKPSESQETNLPENNSNEPRRPHRSVSVDFLVSQMTPASAGASAKATATAKWPRFNASAEIYGGVLGEKHETLFTDFSPNEFRPDLLGVKLAESLRPRLAMLDLAPISISRREGRWVYLKKGAAYGITIGMHLVGPKGAQLHVIQWLGNKNVAEPRVDEDAVALVRKEDLATPLKKGDLVWLDPDLFPDAALKKAMTSQGAQP